MGYRLAGLALLLIEGMLLWFYILHPPSSTQSDAIHIAASTSSYLIPFALFIGCGLLLIGRYFFMVMAGKESIAPASFGVVMVIVLLVCGPPLKLWLDNMIAVRGYGPPGPINVTLHEPVAVRYDPDSIDITTANGKHYKIIWAKLRKIDLLAVALPRARFESKTQHIFFWEFWGTDLSRVAFPFLNSTSDLQMQQEIRDHAGPILADPFSAIQDKINRCMNAACAHTVWTRNWNSGPGSQPH